MDIKTKSRNSILIINLFSEQSLNLVDLVKAKSESTEFFRNI